MFRKEKALRTMRALRSILDSSPVLTRVAPDSYPAVLELALLQNSADNPRIAAERVASAAEQLLSLQLLDMNRSSLDSFRPIFPNPIFFPRI
jgi:hypothetical protein